MFKVGDRVIHDSYGLCKIRAIEVVNDMDYGKQDYYVIDVGRTKIMIPVFYADTLRYPIKKGDVPKILETLTIFEKAPNGVFYEEAIDTYTKKIIAGGVLETAECLRDLTLVGEKNILTGAAKNLLERVNRLLEDEIALANSIGKVEARKLIKQHLNKAREKVRCNRKK